MDNPKSNYKGKLLYFEASPSSLLFLFFINRYAIGDATNKEDNVPNTTPRS